MAKWSDYAPSSISKLIRRARERHLLTPTSKGRPGGQLTPRAKTLLGEVPAKRVADWEQWTEWMFGPEAARQEKEKNR